MIDVVILDNLGKEVAKANIPAPGSRKFYLDVGKYKIEYSFPREIELESSDSKFLVEEQRFLIKVLIEYIPGKQENAFRASVILESKITVPKIVMTAVSITAIGNLTTLGSVIVPKPPLPLRPPAPTLRANPSNRFPLGGSAVPTNPFSLEVEQRLLACFKVNFKNFLNIPDTADFIKLYLKSETLTPELTIQLVQMVEFYEKYTSFQTTIKKCDPTLWQKLVDETEQARAYNSNMIIVNASVVNVRSGPSIKSEIIGELLYNHRVLLDNPLYSALSENSKVNLAQGNGWYPVRLSQGQNGYINSKYVRHP
jgi:hypothetical protein